MIAESVAIGRRVIGDWSATSRNHTRNGKTVAMVAEVAIKISRQEVAPRPHAMWDQDLRAIYFLDKIINFSDLIQIFLLC